MRTLVIPVRSRLVALILVGTLCVVGVAAVLLSLRKQGEEQLPLHDVAIVCRIRGKGDAAAFLRSSDSGTTALRESCFPFAVYGNTLLFLSTEGLVVVDASGTDRIISLAATDVLMAKDPFVAFLSPSLAAVGDMGGSVWLVDIGTQRTRPVPAVRFFAPRRPAREHIVVDASGRLSMYDALLQAPLPIPPGAPEGLGRAMPGRVDYDPESGLVAYMEGDQVLLRELRGGPARAIGRRGDPLRATGVEIQPSLRQVWVRYRCFQSLSFRAPVSRIRAYDYSGMPLGIVIHAGAFDWFEGDSVVLTQKQAELFRRRIDPVSFE